MLIVAFVDSPDDCETVALFRLFPLLLVVLLLAGCGGGRSGVPSQTPGGESGNLLQNPGFEQGVDPWHTMDTAGWSRDFDVNAGLAHSGAYSAHLKLVPPPEPSPNRVFGVVQDIDTSEVPEYVSGYYRVENWQKATPIQYLQCAVIVFVKDPVTGVTTNTQIRYLLAGAATEPFPIGNAKFIFINKSDPAIGQWVHFGRNVREDFQQAWGSVPKNVTSVRIFFETRYDSPTAIQPQMAGDVYYDDLYAGSKAGAPAN
jgi:hypothetical protein